MALIVSLLCHVILLQQSHLDTQSGLVDGARVQLDSFKAEPGHSNNTVLVPGLLKGWGHLTERRALKNGHTCTNKPTHTSGYMYTFTTFTHSLQLNIQPEKHKAKILIHVQTGTHTLCSKTHKHRFVCSQHLHAHLILTPSVLTTDSSQSQERDLRELPPSYLPGLFLLLEGQLIVEV